MRPLLISTFDTYGGAARAAYRLHHGLIISGYDSRMLVQEKCTDDWTVTGPGTKLAHLKGKIRANGDALPLVAYRNRQEGFFSNSFLPDNIQNNVKILNPDILHLHWVSYGFLKIETLSRINIPIIWTLHDMWPFSGGCHYSGGCHRYENKCGRCPQLSSEVERDLSRWNYARKDKNWKSIPFTIVSPSNWLAECAGRSSLFNGLPIKVIPNGVDLNLFSVRDKKMCRDIFSLPHNKKIILAGGIDCKSDKRKGLDFLIPALHYLKESIQTAELVIVGATKPETIPDFGMPVHYLGMLNDDISLPFVYGAADLFVAPSREENLSNMVLEAISCGLPCVAFAIGGMPDMIDHKDNGFLAHPFDAADLAAGIALILKDDTLRCEMSSRSREKAERVFDMEIVAGHYGSLYEEVLHTRKDVVR